MLWRYKDELLLNTACGWNIRCQARKMGSWMVKSVEEFSFHSWKIIARNEPSSVLRKKKNVSNEMATDTLTQIYSVSYVSGSVWKSYCLLFKSPFLEYVLPRTSSETNGFWAPCSLPAFWHLVYCPSHIQQSKTGSLLGCQVLSALSSLHTPALLTHFLLLLSSPLLSCSLTCCSRSCEGK